MEMLPSPEILKNKIIIKAKKPSEQNDGESEANESSDDEEKNESDCDDYDDLPHQVKSKYNPNSALTPVEDLDVKAAVNKTDNAWRSISSEGSNSFMN